VGKPDRPTRTWCLLASLAPDLDGLSLLFGQDAYADYHHYLLHNVTFGVAVTAVASRWTGRRPAALALVFAAFLSHVAGDYCGSGPGWPLWPFRPFSDAMFLCTGAWNLTSWQNTMVTAIALALTLVIADRRGYTPLETFAPATDRLVVDTLRLRLRTVPCAICGARAWFRCRGCGAAVCETHGVEMTRIARRCPTCVGSAAPRY
jgi:hypothetical protein